MCARAHAPGPQLRASSHKQRRTRTVPRSCWLRQRLSVARQHCCRACRTVPGSESGDGWLSETKRTSRAKKRHADTYICAHTLGWRWLNRQFMRASVPNWKSGRQTLQFRQAQLRLSQSIHSLPPELEFLVARERVSRSFGDLPGGRKTTRYERCQCAVDEQHGGG